MCKKRKKASKRWRRKENSASRKEREKDKSYLPEKTVSGNGEG